MLAEVGMDPTACGDGLKVHTEEARTPQDANQGEESNIRLQRYKSEWRQLSAGLEEVRRLAITGALRTSRLHSIAWGVLLGVLPQDSDLWLNAIRKNRKKYAEIRQRVICDPRNGVEPEDNPLSQKDESKWNQHFRDAELRTLIELDVIRSYPGVEFFKQPEIQEAMVKVLFCFARETPLLLYRQGMHEILAPLLFVLQSDHKAAEHTPLEQDLLETMDPAFIEHDSYALFKAIMSGIEKFYRVNDLPTKKSAYLPVGVTKPVNVTPKRNENEVVHHLALIRDNLLIPHDPELAEHLQNCDITLSLFGIRWLRILFGREFHLHDLLILWDVMFAEGGDFDLAGYVMVSMLVAIRSLLINNETIICLTHLMHYPSSIDIQYIIDYALHLKNPNLYSKPMARQVQLPTDSPYLNLIKSVPKKTPSRKTRKAIVNIKKASAVDDSDVMEGLEEADLLRDELLSAQNVMNLCKIKLSQYEKTLRKSLPHNLPNKHPAIQALGGIRELCVLLQRETDTSSENEVESALEADEIANSQKATANKGVLPPSTTQQAKQQIQQNTSKSGATAKGFVGNNNTKEVALKLIKEQVNCNGEVRGAPSADPLGLRTK